MNQQTLVPYKAITKLFILSRQVVESRAHRESQAPAHRARNQNLPAFILSRQVVESRAHRESQAPAHRARNQNLPALPPNFRPHPEW